SFDRAFAQGSDYQGSDYEGSDHQGSDHQGSDHQGWDSAGSWSAVFQRLIQQLPAGGQILQHPLQPLAIERMPRAGAAAEGGQQSVVVDIGKTEIDASLALIVIVIGIDTGGLNEVLAIFPKAVA